MTLFDRITEGERERNLLEKIRQGLVTSENIAEHSLPFFVKAQIQTNSLCNGRCVTCPYPETSKKLPQGEMTEDTFLKIVSQFKGKQVERTSLFLMNEPLVDPRLDKLCATLKKEVPETKSIIFTNGLLLTKERAISLSEAGVAEIDISVTGFTKKSHDQVMKGVDFDRVMKNLIEVGRLSQDNALKDVKIKVIALTIPGAEKGEKEFREATGLDIFTKPVTNRAGLINTATLGSNEKSDTINICQRPFVKAYILYNGDMILCNCDWMRTTVIGNIHESTLEELWTGPKMMAIRKRHLKGDISNCEPCDACDYPYLI